MHLVFPAVEFDKAGIDLLALGEPFARELRVQVHHAQVHTPFFGAEEVKKALIAPDDAAVIQAEDCDGQGEMEKRAVLGVLRLIGDALNIGVQLFRPGTPGHQSIDAQHHDDRAFRRRQIIHLEEYGAGHKKDHKQQIDPGIGLCQTLDIFIVFHGAPPVGSALPVKAQCVASQGTMRTILIQEYIIPRFFFIYNRYFSPSRRY